MGKSTYTPTSRDLVIAAARELVWILDNPIEKAKYKGIQYEVECDQAYIRLVQTVKKETS